MIKKGFTLAEVLVTLGLIGIVAAVTLPALNSDIRAQQIGPSLAKAVNTLENASRLYLVQNDYRRFSSAPCVESDNGILDCLKDTMNGTVGTKNDFEFDDGDTSDEPMIFTKDGMEYVYTGTTEEPDGMHFLISIDINGSKRPNKYGIDKFKVDINNNGFVIPEGANSAWVGTCDANGVTMATDCAGSIAENGWKVIYKLSNIQ